MIKVKFDDYEVVEVSGDLKEVKEFVKSYMDEMDKDILLHTYSGPEDEYEDEDLNIDADAEEEHDAADEVDYRHRVLKFIHEVESEVAAAKKKAEKTVGDDLDISKYAAMTTDPDYKVRFRAEYHELRIRRAKLVEMLKKWEEGKLDFTPACSWDVLYNQARWMNGYLNVLKARASIEGIEL